MFRSSILSLAVLLISSASAYACGTQPYTLQFNAGEVSPLIETRLSSDNLQAMLSAPSSDATAVKSDLMPGYRTRGLTSVRYKSGYSAKFLSTSNPDGTWCSNITSLTVDFSFAEQPKIYLASDIPEGSCRYRAVMAHERQHYEIALATLAAGRKWMGSKLDTLLSGDGFSAETADAADAALDKRVLYIVDTITKRLYEAADAKNRDLDTPASYQELTDACPGEP